MAIKTVSGATSPGGRKATQSPGFSRQTTASVGAIAKPAADKPRQPRLAPKTKPFPGLSFVTDQRGRVPMRDWFDVPAENYGNGYVTGLNAAREFALMARTAPGSFGPVSHLVTEVAQHCLSDSNHAGESESRRGAACAFLSVVAAAFDAAAQRFDLDGYIVGKLAEIERADKFFAARQARQRADFVQRMLTAKAAKRAASQAEGVVA